MRFLPTNRLWGAVLAVLMTAGLGAVPLDAQARPKAAVKTVAQAISKAAATVSSARPMAWVSQDARKMIGGSDVPSPIRLVSRPTTASSVRARNILFPGS